MSEFAMLISKCVVCAFNSCSELLLYQIDLLHHDLQFVILGARFPLEMLPARKIVTLHGFVLTQGKLFLIKLLLKWNMTCPLDKMWCVSA